MRQTVQFQRDMVRDMCASGVAGLRNMGGLVGDRISQLRGRFTRSGYSQPVEQVRVCDSIVFKM